MLQEIRKSINSILYERIASPFYGTFLVSWLIWNWQIIYLTFFISEQKLSINKLEYINSNLLKLSHSVTFPLISTILLLTIFPFISNGAFFLNLLFRKWRTTKKNQIESKQLISLEKSIELREQIRTQEERFEKLLEDKNEEIKILNAEIKDYKKNSGSQKNVMGFPAGIPIPLSDEADQKELEEVLNDGYLLSEFKLILEKIQSGSNIKSHEAVDSKSLLFFETNNYVKNKEGFLSFTEKGNALKNKYAERSFNKKKSGLSL